MILDIEYSQKIITPEIPDYYYSRERLLDKVLAYEFKRIILITAPAGYGKTSFAIEYFHKLKKDLKIWISISHYDNSIENFFLLLALAFENNLPNSNFGAKVKSVLSKSQNSTLNEKINNVISSFSSDLHSYLDRQNKKLCIFLDDFHNIDESEEVCSSLNYFFEYLPSNVSVVFISRRDPKKINYPKFLAKNWLGRITQSDLAFTNSDIKKLIKTFGKKTKETEKQLLDEFLKTAEGWITAIRLVLSANNFNVLRSEDFIQSKTDIFEYFTNEIYNACSAEEKELLLTLSLLESFDKKVIDDVLGISNGYNSLLSIYESNVFISKEDETFRFHELFRKFLNKIAEEELSESKINEIFIKIGRHYLKNKEWREVYIALNYLILGKDYKSLENWIRLNASDKLLLIHSSGLFAKIEEIQDKNFKSSVEFILLRVNTFIYKENNINKALDYLEGILRNRFSLNTAEAILVDKKKIKSSDVNYYVEILMLICNCNFLNEGISERNVLICEHLLKFNLPVEQEIQFINSLIKSYISSAQNSKSVKYIKRLKNIFNKLMTDYGNGTVSADENAFIESIFSMLIFFDYGDYKTGRQVIKFILNSIDFNKYDLSNYGQVCFALFASYNVKDFEIFFNQLKLKSREKDKTIFSAYRNQLEFWTILRRFLNLEFKLTIRELEILRKNIHLKNYIYFIDALILYCHNLVNHPYMVNRLSIQGDYHISKTRLLILQLEANLLLEDVNGYSRIIEEINQLGRENFTMFNQSVILFCECYNCAVKENISEFEIKFNKFLKLCRDYDYDDYLIFRAKANKLSYVFEFAYKNNFANSYLMNCFSKGGVEISSSSEQIIKLRVQFLNKSRIWINGRELTDNLWQRPKSKSIFLYILFRTYYHKEIAKENIIDDILYNSKNVNYDAIVDVEINKVRKTFQDFLSEVVSESAEKEVIIFKSGKYHLSSRKFKIEISIDVEDFKRLASSNDINNMMKAFEMYQTDFADTSYHTWAEDVRENLRFIYSDTALKLISYFEKAGDKANLVPLLEKLVDIDFSDEDIMMKLLSIYNKDKEYNKFKFLYKLYEKRLKKEFNVQPSEEMQKFFGSVKMNSKTV